MPPPCSIWLNSRGAFDRVAGDLRALRAMIADSDDLRRLLRHPLMSRAEQQKGVLAVAVHAQLSELTQRFLGVVAGNRRLFAVPKMIDAFLAKLSARRGEVVASVASAMPLSDAQRDGLVAALGKTVGASVAIDAVVDPSLLGGLVVKVGSRMVDSSLRTKLQQLKLVMKGVG